MTEPRAFHNDPAIKEKYLQRVLDHQKADRIIQGNYWDGKKGCAVGCTLEMSNTGYNIHGQYEVQLGIPKILARLEDGIFEGLSVELSKQWPYKFLESINLGADLSKVWPKFAVWLLGGEKYGVIQFAKTEKLKEAIQKVIDFYSSNRPVGVKEWEEARRAAYAADAADAAAAYAAYAADAAAADAAAADAAAYAAYAAAAAAYAAYADAAAADAAAADAAAYAAYAAAAKKQEVRAAQAEKLLEILRETK